MAGKPSGRVLAPSVTELTVKHSDVANTPRVLLICGADDISDAELRAYARSVTPSALHVSRSYCGSRALVVWHDCDVGIDIEGVSALDEGFAATICTPAELEAARYVRDRNLCLTSMWSGKEALAKALGEPVSYDPTRLESPRCWPDGVCGRWRATPLDVGPALVAWLCWSTP